MRKKNPMYPNWEDGGPLPKYVRKRESNIAPIDFTKAIQAPDADQVRWMEQYISSPKYLERLRNFYKDAEGVRRTRFQQLSKAFIDDNTKLPGEYDPVTNTGSINTPESMRYGLRRDESVIHELSHVTNANPFNAYLRMNYPEEFYMADKDVVYKRGNGIDEKKKKALGSKRSLSSVILDDESMHDFAPNELKSDIDSFRYLLEKEGLYKAGTENMNRDILKKAKNNFNLNSSHLFKRLQQHYEDDDLIDIMNKVAYEPSQVSPVAQDGEKIPFIRRSGNINDQANQFIQPNMVAINNLLANDPRNYREGTATTLRNLTGNLSAYFLGTKNPNTIPSPYKPTRSNNPNAEYTTWKYLKNDIKGDLLSETYINNIRSQQDSFKKQNPDYKPSYINDKSFDEYYNYISNSPNSRRVSTNSINLGQYTISPGKDKRGRYLSVHDTYDWDLIEEGAGIKMNPWETYDRIYEDEWDKIKANTKSSRMKNTKKKNYGGKMPPAYEHGGFVNGNMFTNDFPNYIPDYNGINGIPPKVYEFGGTAPSDAIPVQGPFPYQTYGYQSGYGQIPPPKVYANGGIVPTSNSFAGSPFPQDYRWETYPAYISEYPRQGYNPTAYMQEAASGLTIGPGDPPGGPVGDTTTSKRPVIGAVDIYGNVVNTPSLTRTGTSINNEVQDQKRLQYIQQLSKKYGVPTNQIYTKRARRYNDAYNDIDNKYLEYELLDPKTNKWVTHRQNFDDKNVGYPVGAYSPSRENGGYAESGIHIKPENRGKFNATKKRTGKSTEELTHSKNPITRKRAIFAQNASTWDHAANGGGPYGDMLPVYNPMNIGTSLENTPSQIQDYMSVETPSDKREPGTGFRNVMRGIGEGLGSVFGGMNFNTAGPIMGLGAISNAFSAQQDAVKESATQTRRNVTQGPIYSPYRYGTGSTALYANGGSITSNDDIQQAITTLRNAGYDVQMD